MAESVKPRILFVDDEPELLAGLRTSLRRQRKVWDLAFAVGGEEALERIAECPPAVLVSDMRMPGMDGATLLHRVREEHPATLRIILTGEADEQATLRAIPVAQQWLSKPCAKERLVAAIERALRTRVLTDAAGAIGVGGTEALPSPPAMLEELRRVTSDPVCSLEDVARVIEKDPGMATKLLQLVNSAYFSLPREVTAIQEAVSRLGLQTVTSLATVTAAFQTLAPQDQRFVAFVQEIQDHASFASRIAARLAVEVDLNPGIAASVGLLHDVGMLVLASRLPDVLAETIDRAEREELRIEDAEKRCAGPDHSTLGGALLSAWGLPLELVEAAAAHHAPLPEEADQYTCLAHVANVLADEIGARARGRGFGSVLDEEALDRAGWSHRWAAWRAIADEEAGSPT